MASTVVTELVAKIRVAFDKTNLQKLERGLDRVRAGFRKIGQTARGVFSRMAGPLRSLAGQLATVFGVGAITRWTTNLIRAGDRLDKLSRQLGLTATELRAWEFAANLAGVPLENMSAGLNKMFSNLRMVQQGSKMTVDFFRELGFEMEGIEKRSVNELLLESADIMAGLETATERAAAANFLFGRAGRMMLPLLQDGSEAVQELLDEVYAIAGPDGFDGFAKAAADAEDATTRFKFVLELTSQQLAASYLPLLTSGLTKLAEWARLLAPIIKRTSVLKAGLVVLGGIILLAFGPAILATLVWLSALSAVFLVIEDFVSFLEGKKSVFGEFLELLSPTEEGQASHFDVWKATLEDVVELLDLILLKSKQIGNLVLGRDSAVGDRALTDAQYSRRQRPGDAPLFISTDPRMTDLSDPAVRAAGVTYNVEQKIEVAGAPGMTASEVARAVQDEAARRLIARTENVPEGLIRPGAGSGVLSP